MLVNIPCTLDKHGENSVYCRMDDSKIINVGHEFANALTRSMTLNGGVNLVLTKTKRERDVEYIPCTFDKHNPGSKDLTSIKDGRLIYIGRKYAGALTTFRMHAGFNLIIEKTERSDLNE